MMKTVGANAIAIEEVGFGKRTFNCLRRAKLFTLGEVAAKTEEELLELRSIGQKELEEIMEKLNEYGLKLKIDVDALYEEYCQMEEDGYFDVEDEPQKSVAFQVMMRDTHGIIETENWGVVTNACTFDDEGKPVVGGMYDPAIFGAYDMEKALKRVFHSSSPDQVVGNFGVMELALPVCDPNCPKVLDPDKWVHITAIPVLPTAFRGMSSDGRQVGEDAAAWNSLAELNFVIPTLLEENPDREEELQAKLQEAVNAVYALYNRGPILKGELEMHRFLYHAMMPLEVFESYDIVVDCIKTIKAMADLKRNLIDVEDEAFWIRNLCRICNVVGYDSEEVAEYLTWAEEVLSDLDAWESSCSAEI